MNSSKGNRRPMWLGLVLLFALGTIAVAVALLSEPQSVTGVSLLAGTLATVMMSPRDVGRVLNLSASRVIQLEKEGLLAAERDSSGRRFFRRSVVTKFAAERAARLTAASRDPEGRFGSTPSPQLLIVPHSIESDGSAVPSTTETSPPPPDPPAA